MAESARRFTVSVGMCVDRHDPGACTSNDRGELGEADEATPVGPPTSPKILVDCVKAASHRCGRNTAKAAKVTDEGIDAERPLADLERRSPDRVQCADDRKLSQNMVVGSRTRCAT